MTQELSNMGITALARHYGVTEAEITEDLADFSESGVRSRVLLENVTMSLIAALATFNDYGFDDAAVSAAENMSDQLERGEGEAPP